jgi:prepilin-type processing-associated H-X9-DG protein
MIQFACTCGNRLQADDDHAGKEMMCPKCGRDIVIPESGQHAGTVAVPPGRGETIPRKTRRIVTEQVEAWPAESPPARTSRKAVASLILGICSIVLLCTFLTGIPAIILGILSLREISQSRGRLKGQGLAIGAIVTGALGIVFLLPAAPVAVGLLLPAVQKVREAANRTACQNQLKQLAIAMHKYHSVHGRFPPAVVYSKDGKPLYSWRVLLLPYVEADNVYSQFKLDEPWDSPTNINLLPLMPETFREPSQPTSDTGTFYQVLVGSGTAFEDRQGARLQDFTNGVSNTLLIVEAEDAVPWSKPADLPYDPNQPFPKLGQRHGGGANAAMADGAVRFIDRGTGDAMLHSWGKRTARP